MALTHDNPDSPDSADVCIRGDGLVGRTLALLLARQNLRVSLVAPGLAAATASHPQGHGDVRAYALNAPSKALLESLGCWPPGDATTAVLNMAIHGDHGGQLHFDAATEGQPALNWIVDVPALEARLTQALHYQPLVQRMAQPQVAALTVICEGRASQTRDEWGVDFALTPYPQHAIATRVQCQTPHGQTARQWFGQGSVLAFLPLAGAAGNAVAVVWSLPQERLADLMALAPPEFAQALEVASGHALGSLALIGERASWPLQRARASRWVGEQTQVAAQDGRGGAWALAGDAAHSIHPLAGQGLNLGLADVAELARVLRQRESWRSVGDRKLLRRYERARQSDVLAMGWATDGLQQLFDRAGEPWRSFRNQGMSGFDRCAPLKRWVARRAMGAASVP